MTAAVEKTGQTCFLYRAAGKTGRKPVRPVFSTPLFGNGGRSSARGVCLDVMCDGWWDCQCKSVSFVVLRLML